MVTVLFFASVRERAGQARQQLDLPGTVATVSDLIGHLRAADPRLAAALAVPTVLRAAVNQQMVSLDAALADGDEIALFPAVTGG